MKMPRAREEGLMVRELPDEVLVYDLERHEAHCLNKTAALVWKNCDGRMTVATMAERLGNELKKPVDEGVVLFAVDQIAKKHLLKEGKASREGAYRFSRRDALKFGLAAASVALPLVSSIVVPAAAQTQSFITCPGRVTNCSQCPSGPNEPLCGPKKQCQCQTDSTGSMCVCKE